MNNSECPICFTSHFVDLSEWDQFLTERLPRHSNGTHMFWCAKCNGEDIKKKEEAARIRQKPPPKTPEDLWRDICPVEYRTEQEGGFTNEKRLLKKFNAKDSLGTSWTVPILADFDSEEYGSPILIAGPPGAMKTRAAWRLARNVFNKGLPIHPFTCWSFQAAAQKAAGEYRSEEWLKSLLKGFILIDDLGKSPWTDYTAATFFELVEQVVAHHAKLVITANDSSVELAESIGQRKTISPEIGAGILRRIREHFLRVVACKPTA